MKLNNSVRKFEINNISMIGNFNNGSIIGLDSTGIEFINELEKNPNIDINNINKEEKELLVAMQEREFFNNEYKCELNSAYVHVTDICNLHCVGCYSFVEKRNCKKNLSYEELKHILNQLKENGVKQIVFSGGEPFLRNDMADICKYAKEFLKIDNVCVISNGTMDYTRYEAAIPYLDEINISIDGYSKDTRFIRDNGIMEQVISTINHLKDKISVSMIATLHAKNYMHMDKYIKMSKDLNVRLSFSIFTVDPTVDEFRDYLFNDKQLVDVAKTLNYMDEQVSILDVPTSSVSLLCRDGCEVGRELISIGADEYRCRRKHISMSYVTR